RARGGAVSFQSYGVYAVVRAASARHLAQFFDYIDILIVDGFRAALLFGHAQALRKAVERNHTLRAEEVTALDGQQADRTAPPHGYGVAGLDAAVVGCHISGRKNIR